LVYILYYILLKTTIIPIKVFISKKRQNNKVTENIKESIEPSNNTMLFTDCQTLKQHLIIFNNEIKIKKLN